MKSTSNLISFDGLFAFRSTLNLFIFLVFLCGVNPGNATSIILENKSLNEENTPPIARCKDITVSANNNCEAEVEASEFNRRSFDADGDPLSFSVSPSGPFQYGGTRVVLTVSDGTSSSTCNARIEVVDYTPPSINCLAPDPQAPLIFEYSDLGTVLDADQLASYSDNCYLAYVNPLKIRLSCSHVNKVTPIQIVVRDYVGFTRYCNSYITVKNPAPPSISCLYQDSSEPLLVNLRGRNASLRPWDVASYEYSGYCGSNIIEMSQSDFDCSDLNQTIPLTITITDRHDNANSCTSYIKVNDDRPPGIECKGNPVFPVEVDINFSNNITLDPEDLAVFANADFCGKNSVKLSKSEVGCEDVSQILPITVTVEDPGGNESSCISYVLVNDTRPPWVSCKYPSSNSPKIIDLSGTSVDLEADDLIDYNDNCGPLKVTLSKPALTCIDLRFNFRSITIEVEDLSGNKNSCISYVKAKLVDDGSTPMVECKYTSDSPLVLALDPENDNKVTVTTDQLATWDDNICVKSAVVDTRYGRTFDCNYVNLSRSLKIEIFYENGTYASCRSWVKIIDETPPEITCNNPDKNNPKVVLAGPGGPDGTTPISLYMVGFARDNCEVASANFSREYLDCSDIGTVFPVTVSVTDKGGNTSESCTSYLSVIDKNRPRLECQNAKVLLDKNGMGKLEIDQVLISSSDNCGAVKILGFNQSEFDCSHRGFNWVRLDGEDDHSNVGNCWVQIEVVDGTAPVPDQETLPDITGQCSASVSSTPTATSNCEGTIIGTTTDPLSYSTQGIHIITWTFDDGKGNVSTQTQKVIIDDISKPMPDLNALPILKGECSVSVSSAPTATDNCAGTIIGTTKDPLSYSSQGTHIITWTFDDGNGNVEMQTQTVIIKDISAPVPNVTSLPVVKGLCEVGLEPPFATDNCAGQVVGSTSDPLYFNNEGTYSVTWIFDDGNGNTSSQDQTIVLEDDIAPVPDRETLPTLRAQCGLTVSTKPTATDRCNGTIHGTTTDPLTYNTQGVHIITWTFDDGNGNTASQTQRVVIRDRQAPVPDQANLPTLTGSCSIIVSNFPTATDNCAGSVRATTDSPLEFEQEGTFAILWKYDDGNGNTNIQTQWVIVGGDAAPNARCKDISLPMIGNGSVSIKAADIDNGSFDDCSSVSLLISPAGGSIFGTPLPPAPSMDLYCKDGKEQNLLLWVANENGNSAYCQAKVTLEGTDTDNDGILDNCDNCQDTYNPDQKDENNNGTGDACEQNSNPGPNPGGWGAWNLKKEGKEENNIITKLKAYPNPFQEEINLSFELIQKEKTTIEIFNIHGQSVHTLLSEVIPGGEHRVLWDGRDQNGQSMPAGIYLVRLRAGKALINQKVLLQR